MHLTACPSPPVSPAYSLESYYCNNLSALTDSLRSLSWPPFPCPLTTIPTAQPDSPSTVITTPFLTPLYCVLFHPIESTFHLLCTCTLAAKCGWRKTHLHPGWSHFVFVTTNPSGPQCLSTILSHVPNLPILLFSLFVVLVMCYFLYTLLRHNLYIRQCTYF